MLSNEQIIETFRAIFDGWKRELREWDSSRRLNEGLTFGSLSVDHVCHDVPTTERHPVPQEHAVPDSC